MIVITCKSVMAEYAWGATPHHDILLHDTIQHGVMMVVGSSPSRYELLCCIRQIDIENV